LARIVRWCSGGAAEEVAPEASPHEMNALSSRQISRNELARYSAFRTGAISSTAPNQRCCIGTVPQSARDGHAAGRDWPNCTVRMRHTRARSGGRGGHAQAGRESRAAEARGAGAASSALQPSRPLSIGPQLARPKYGNRLPISRAGVSLSQLVRGAHDRIEYTSERTFTKCPRRSIP
jgi:hypothetical protein